MILLPHGGYPLVVATLASMAWMTTISHDGCDFVRITGPAVEKLTNSDTYPFAELGFRSFRIPTFYPDFNEWQIRYSDSCLSYDVLGDEAFDSFWIIASTTNSIGMVFGGAACLFLWVSATCVAITRLNWRLLGAQLMLAAFFHVCSFFWFFNNLCYIEGSVCHWFYGSNSNVAAFGLYLISSVCILLKYPEPTLVKLVRRRVEADFQKYEKSEVTQPPSEFDASSAIHSVSGFSNTGSNRQRSLRGMYV